MLCQQTAFHLPARAMELTRYTWPANIRELQNVVERIFATFMGIEIDTTIIQLHLEDRLESDINLQLRNAGMKDIRQAMVLSRGKHA